MYINYYNVNKKKTCDKTNEMTNSKRQEQEPCWSRQFTKRSILSTFATNRKIRPIAKNWQLLETKCSNYM